MLKYTYHIDLDERGYFDAHVENTRGRVVFEMHYPELSSYCEECGAYDGLCDCLAAQIMEENWGLLDHHIGYMKHKHDVRGIESYLREMKLMPPNMPLEMA